MYTEVEIKIDLGRKLTVPDDAVIDTGVRQIVYVDKGDGNFEPREVVLGARTEGFREVLRGLKAGEKVAASAAFLVDSEAQLRGVKPLADRRPVTPGRTDPMIAKVIEFSAKNRFLVFLLVLGVARLGHLGAEAHPPRRPSRSERHPGDHLYGVAGAKPRPHRGPGDLPDHLDAPGGAEGAGGPRLLLPGEFVHLRDLRRGDGHLLGAKPDPRIPPGGEEQASRRCQSDPGARRHEPRLGVLLRPGR